ncbi:MAG: SLBB domain-containing protein [Chlamydiales bacterium]
MKNSLGSAEWLLAATLLLFIASFLLIAKINGRKAASALAAASFEREEILVAIEGAVKKPGEYLVEAGTTVGQALRKARPLPDANLKALPLNEIIDAPLRLCVEELQEIAVTVTGAVEEPVLLRLPPKSRISDLKSKVALTKEADKTFFRRRKILRNGDKIEVPKKTVEDNSVH